jgi:hypothetical protein
MMEYLECTCTDPCPVHVTGGDFVYCTCCPYCEEIA